MPDRNNRPLLHLDSEMLLTMILYLNWAGHRPMLLMAIQSRLQLLRQCRVASMVHRLGSRSRLRMQLRPLVPWRNCCKRKRRLPWRQRPAKRATLVVEQFSFISLTWRARSVTMPGARTNHWDRT